VQIWFDWTPISKQECIDVFLCAPQAQILAVYHRVPCKRGQGDEVGPWKRQIYVRDSLMIKHQERGFESLNLLSPPGLCARSPFLVSWHEMISWNFNSWSGSPAVLIRSIASISLLMCPGDMQLETQRLGFICRHSPAPLESWTSCSRSISGLSHPLPYLWMLASVYLIPL
jgi:hypothetical protein